MKACVRPNCAIRSHGHELSDLNFARLHKYLPKFCDIADRYPLNNKELHDNYNYLLKSERLDKKCVEILRDMLIPLETEKNFELKKLRVLYVFSMCSTPVLSSVRIVSPKLADAIKSAYYRMLRQCYDDEEFITQIIFNYRA